MDAIVEFQIKTVPTERPDLDDIFDRHFAFTRTTFAVWLMRGRKPIG